MKKRKTRTITAIAITAMLIYGAVSLFTTMLQLHRAEKINSEIRTEIRSAEEERERLVALISESDSDKSREALARKRLGLVKPGEIIFTN